MTKQLELPAIAQSDNNVLEFLGGLDDFIESFQKLIYRRKENGTKTFRRSKFFTEIKAFLIRSGKEILVKKIDDILKPAKDESGKSLKGKFKDDHWLKATWLFNDLFIELVNLRNKTIDQANSDFNERQKDIVG